MRKVRVKVPASTTNLGPGFDVLGMALNLYNIIELEVSRSGLQIEVEGEGADMLSRDESNLVYQSAKRFFEKIGEKMPSMIIRIINNIPLARGLGSSGTAIVGGLMGANVISNAGLTRDEILNMAAEIDGHPDNVGASIIGGFVIASLTETGVAYMKVVPPKPIKAVVAVPEFHLLTSEARRILPKCVDLPTAVFNISRSSLLVASLITGNFQLLRTAVDDRIHQPYRQKLIPGVQDVFQSVNDADEDAAVAISGAGSSIVAFCYKDKGEAIGEGMRKAFLKHGIKSRIMMLDIDKEGVVIC